MRAVVCGAVVPSGGMPAVPSMATNSVATVEDSRVCERVNRCRQDRPTRRGLGRVCSALRVRVPSASAAKKPIQGVALRQFRVSEVVARIIASNLDAVRGVDGMRQESRMWDVGWICARGGQDTTPKRVVVVCVQRSRACLCTISLENSAELSKVAAS